MDSLEQLLWGGGATGANNRNGGTIDLLSGDSFHSSADSISMTAMEAGTSSHTTQAGTVDDALARQLEGFTLQEERPKMKGRPMGLSAGTRVSPLSSKQSRGGFQPTSLDDSLSFFTASPGKLRSMF